MNIKNSVEIEDEPASKRWVAVDDIKDFKGRGMAIHKNSPNHIIHYREAYNQGVNDTMTKLNEELK